MSLFDIDELKRAVDSAVWARNFAAGIVEAVQVPLVELKTVSANEAFRQSCGEAPRRTAGGVDECEPLGLKGEPTPP